MKHEKRGFPLFFTGPPAPSRLAVVALLAGLLPFWACAAGPVLSGEWESTIGMEPPTGIWSTETDFEILVEFETWSASVSPELEDSVWRKLDFEVAGPIGSFDIESDLRFEPYKDRFKDWVTTVEWADEDIAAAITWKLTRTTDYLNFELERAWESIDMEVDLRLRAPSGGCSFSFYDASMELELALCGIDADLEIELDDDGFEEMVIELSEITVSQVPWATVDLEIERTVAETDIAISADLALESPACGENLTIEFDGSFPNAPSPLPFTIEEIAIEWDLHPWEIEATAILDPDEWIDDVYWLEIEASTELALACCGEGSLDLVMLWTELQLARTHATLTYEPIDTLSLALEFDLNLDAGQLDMLSLTLSLEW